MRFRFVLISASFFYFWENCFRMKEDIRQKLFDHFEGAKELQDQYFELDESLTNTVNELSLHCKPGCGACCLGGAENKEASVFELIPLAIDLVVRGVADEYLEKLQSCDDCSQIVCVSYVNVDEEKGLGHCCNYVLRPFVCRLFGDSLFQEKEDKFDFTGCHWLKEKYRSNPHREELHQRLPIIAETVMKGRSLNELSFQTIMDINSALKEAIQLVKMKQELIEGERGEEE